MKSKNTATVEDAVALRKKTFTLDPEGFVGFNPIVKRTCARITGADGSKYLVAKGMVDVIIKTNPDDEGVQWTVDDVANMEKTAKDDDTELGVSGFKTLGVMVQKLPGQPKFAGILPIMDPPRKDTKKTVADIKASGVAVKMITGDHHNIGKELARQIDLGTDIQTPEDLHSVPEKSKQQVDKILKAD